MIILSVDLGKARTGVAACDENEILVSPLGVIYEKIQENLAQKIVDLAKERRAELIVLGYPKNMDGSLGESARNAENFAEILKSRADFPVVLWDERRTTVTATNILNATNIRGKKRKNIIDAVAAVVILENYLARRKQLQSLTNADII